MRTSIFENYKIFYLIITFITINMMDFFLWSKKSSKFIFYYKTMFSYISVFIAIWVVGAINKYISTMDKLSSPLPGRMFIADEFPLQRLANSFSGFFATMFSKRILRWFSFNRDTIALDTAKFSQRPPFYRTRWQFRENVFAYWTYFSKFHINNITLKT